MDQYTKEEKELVFKQSIKLPCKYAYEIHNLLELAYIKHAFSLEETETVAKIIRSIREGFKLAIEQSKTSAPSPSPALVPARVHEKKEPVSAHVTEDMPQQVQDPGKKSIEDRFKKIRKPQQQQQQYQQPHQQQQQYQQPQQQYQQPQQYQQHQQPQQQQLSPQEQQFQQLNQRINANVENQHVSSMGQTMGVYNPNMYSNTTAPQVPNQLVPVNPRQQPINIGDIKYDTALASTFGNRQGQGQGGNNNGFQNRMIV